MNFSPEKYFFLLYLQNSSKKEIIPKMKRNQEIKIGKWLPYQTSTSCNHPLLMTCLYYFWYWKLELTNERATSSCCRYQLWSKAHYNTYKLPNSGQKLDVIIILNLKMYFSLWIMLVQSCEKQVCLIVLNVHCFSNLKSIF